MFYMCSCKEIEMKYYICHETLANTHTPPNITDCIKMGTLCRSEICINQTTILTIKKRYNILRCIARVQNFGCLVHMDVIELFETSTNNINDNRTTTWLCRPFVYKCNKFLRFFPPWLWARTCFPTKHSSL